MRKEVFADPLNYSGHTVSEIQLHDIWSHRIKKGPSKRTSRNLKKKKHKNDLVSCNTFVKFTRVTSLKQIGSSIFLQSATTAVWYLFVGRKRKNRSLGGIPSLLNYCVILRGYIIQLKNAAA